MKAVRRLPGEWLSQIPRERRNALVTALVLLGILGGLMLYQRWRGGPERLPDTLAGPTAAVLPGTGNGEALPMGSAPAGTNPAGAEAQVAAAEATAASSQPEPVELDFPLSGETDILQPYAIAFSATYGDYRLHPGVDYAAEAGDAALAAAAGTVVGVEPDPAEGVALTVDHGNGMMTRYAGLDRVMVKENASVERGSILGTVGRPAGGARPHLHFEVLKEGDSVDPAAYLNQ